MCCKYRAVLPDDLLNIKSMKGADGTKIGTKAENLGLDLNSEKSKSTCKL